MKIRAFYSDPHFNHTNIIKYCNRPFLNMQEMNDVLISNYNSLINSNDIVIWLGDCFFNKQLNNCEEIISKLNGQKILVLGNHDKNDIQMSQFGFDIVTHELVLNVANTQCRCSHYPITPCPEYELPDRYASRRPKKLANEIILHGHDHNKNKITNIDSINVGVDAWDFKPAMFEDVEKLVIELIEHH